MRKIVLSLLILASIGIATVIGITTYYWYVNENKSNNDDDNDDNDNLSNINNMIINHNCAHLENFINIPIDWINAAKSNLHIVYWHTSHGSQLTEGMAPLDAFMGDPNVYKFNSGGSSGALDLNDRYVEGHDLTDETNDFDDTTRTFLTINSQYNVIMWSWCALDKDENLINQYLNNMNQLESEYPTKFFVYMTGHLEGTGVEGELNIYNEMIRNYCKTNNKILYDFADIESYNPDNVNFLNRYGTDNCTYDGNSNGYIDNEDINRYNWAIEWQNSHYEATYPNGGEWYSCSSAQSQSLNGNMKAFLFLFECS